ncbi:MAG: thioesterase family protein [Flavobacteriales bacterium]|nr:thioesterase family protein [Flavobacteriales bacterium]
MIQTYQGTIYTWQCDFMGHMNVMHYVGIFDQATWNLFGHFGLTAQYLRENDKGMVALEQHIRYKKELLAGDNVRVESEFLWIKGKIAHFRHYMLKSESKEVAAITELTGLHMDIKARKGLEMPAEYAGRIQTWIDENPPSSEND